MVESGKDILKTLKGTETQLNAKVETIILLYAYEKKLVWSCFWCKQKYDQKNFATFEQFSTKIAEHSLECTEKYLNRNRGKKE